MYVLYNLGKYEFEKLVSYVLECMNSLIAGIICRLWAGFF